MQNSDTTNNLRTLVNMGQDPSFLARQNRISRTLLSSAAKRISSISDYYHQKRTYTQLEGEKSLFLVVNGSTSPSAQLYQIQKYLRDIYLGGQFDDESLIYSFILLERFIQKNKVKGQQFNFFKLIAVSLFIAFKTKSDTEIIYLSDFEKISNFSPSHMRELELEFLFTIEFKVTVSQKVYMFYQKTLLQRTRSQ